MNYAQDALQARLRWQSPALATTFLPGAAWAVAVLAFLGYAWMFRSFAVDFPNADDYSQLLAVPYYFAMERSFWDGVRYLASLSIEHRIFTLRLAALVQANYLGGMSFTGLMMFGATILGGTLALLVLHAPRTYRPYVAAIAAALFFAPVNYEAQFWATGALQHFGVLGYAFAALACIRRGGVAPAILGTLFGVAAAFTSANGLMVFPAAAIMLWIAGRRAESLLFAVIGVALFGGYFVGYDPAQATGSRLDAITRPFALARFGLIAIGSVAAYTPGALLVGAGVVAAWCWLLARYRDVPALLLGWTCFLGLSYAAMAVGRLEFGDGGALLSRYRVYSEALIVVTLIALLHVARERLRVALLAAGATAAVAWFGISAHLLTPYIAHASISHETSRAHFLATGHGIYDRFPPQEYGDFLLGRARALGYFRPSTPPDPPVSVTTKAPTVVAPSPLVIERLTLRTNSVTVRGFAPAGATQPVLWLDDGTRRYRAPLHTYPGIDTPFGAEWGFVWGTVTVSGEPSRRFRIGYGVQNDSLQDVVYWTDAWLPDGGH